MARYRFLVTDLTDRSSIEELASLTVSSYARRLSNTGALSARVDLADAAIERVGVANTPPRRTALWVIRNEKLLWGGIIWTRFYRSDEGGFDVSGSTFESYFARRRLRTTLTFAQVDQHRIMWDLLKHTASVPYGNIGIDFGDEPVPSGTLRDRNYYWHERATYLERAEQLAGVVGGPDFTLSPRYDAARYPEVVLAIGTPLGKDSTTVLEYPGNIRNYSWSEDGGNSANFWTSIGEPAGGDEEGPPLMADAQVSAEWGAGYPLLEDVSNHAGVTSAFTLSSFAQAHVAAAAGDALIPQATLRLPEGGEWPDLGDTVTLRITDPYRFPARRDGSPGLILRTRVTGWTVYLSDAEGETVSLEFGEASN